MSGVSFSLDRGNTKAAFDTFYRGAIQRFEQAALKATDAAARKAKSEIRTAMAGAGLGRLGNAIDATSDLRLHRAVKRYPNGGFSASGVVFIRSQSERTRGAIEAYTRGADIRPVRSRWLWIPTDNIPRVSQRERLTPALWVKNGLDRRIGPLEVVRSINGYPLLVVKQTNVPMSGLKRKPRASLKNGRSPKGYAPCEFLVAFVGIPFTARAARIDVSAILRSVQAELPDLFRQAFGAP